ncbi:MAG TPA: o-succinylbenzoate synthase [Lacunisphaera sp.]|nr:o-succinylbenzoate synthase [Lacunisphaera sp.]
MVYRFTHKTYRRPLRVPLRAAHGAWAEREGIILRLEDESGRVGFGEIAPIPWFGTETLAAAEEICRKFGANVTLEALDAIPEQMGCVRFALGQAREQPGKVPAKVRLPVAALLPAGRDALKALAAKLEAGFLAFKWKVGVGAVDDELGLLDDLLAFLPKHAKLRLDANGAWNRRDASRWLERCAGRPVELVEQPVAPAEKDTLRGLARDYPVTLALDESVVRLAEARRWQGLGWPGVFVIKPALAGPLDELTEWINATKADVVLSSAIETALGRSAVLRAALDGSLTKRALGFGTDEVFGDRRWDGPVIGPLADASCIAANPGEELWTALN